ncbi:VanZ family protein [Accumulibacter sp.]|uniref:VanZ family protein n=1 Tax=Accumulibacter sp. TaxID=2053492 RepID=UPI0025D4F0DC|nr:VanZ family protein [Accumulibacter sp.]MCM8612680.1 VanZ family protein [Accumulibacter sp.]MCM8636480.1 VanZ family protein [Accumulibacter sp.]MCM8639371.1 VanZ family protein [Accumulibacter sp.]
MQPVRSWVLLTLAIVGTASLFVLGAQPFAVGLVPPPWDKLAHALLFGALFVVFDRALHLPLAVALALPLLISAADEMHQLFLPGRSASWTDWLAGLCGVAVAAILRRRQS